MYEITKYHPLVYSTQNEKEKKKEETPECFKQTNSRLLN
jgi:hypothetical protein